MTVPRRASETGTCAPADRSSPTLRGDPRLCVAKRHRGGHYLPRTTNAGESSGFRAWLTLRCLLVHQ